MRLLSYGYSNPATTVSGRSILIERALEGAGWTLLRRQVNRDYRGKLLRFWLAAQMPPACDAILLRFPYFLQAIEHAIELKRRLKVPLIVDAMVSQYDTMVIDRRSYADGSPEARQCLEEDHLVGKHADLLIVDTPLQGQYLSELVGWPGEKMIVMPLGSPSVEQFGCPEPERTADSSSISVLYTGSYVPLHGVEALMKGARLAAGRVPNMVFDFYGQGQHLQLARDTAAGHPSICIHGSVNPQESLRLARGGDIVVGIFGESRKADSLLPYKGFDALAMGCCLLTARTPTAELMLRHGEDCWLVNKTPEAICEGLVQLASDADLRRRLAAGALRAYQTRFASKTTIGPVKERIEQLCRERRGT